MNTEIMIVLILLLTAASVIASVILFNKAKKLGKDTDAGLACTRWAYIVIAVYASLVIAGSVYLCIVSSFWLILLVFISPLMIGEGLILTLAFGIYYLVTGNKKDNVDKGKIKIGMTCLIINAAIILTIGTLIILFMSGVIPIRLM